VTRYCWNENCAKEFELRKGGGKHRYCSDSCRLEVWLRRHRSRHNRTSRIAMRKWRRTRSQERRQKEVEYMAAYREKNRELLRLAAKDYTRMKRDPV
jgi:hypothetical protein